MASLFGVIVAERGEVVATPACEGDGVIASEQAVTRAAPDLGDRCRVKAELDITLKALVAVLAELGITTSTMSVWRSVRSKGRR